MLLGVGSSEPVVSIKPRSRRIMIVPSLVVCRLVLLLVLLVHVVVRLSVVGR